MEMFLCSNGRGALRAVPLIYLGERMASFTSHDGSEPVTSSMSQESGNTAQVSECSAGDVARVSKCSAGNIAQASECSAPAIPISAEHNSSVLSVDKLMAVSQKLLPPITPGGEPIFVNEKKYDAILRLRERRARIKEQREKVLLKVKKHYPRCSKGRFAVGKGDQEGASGGRSQAPISIPAVDFYWRFVATNDDEENTGEVAYDSILNLEAPDFTVLLRIMMGDRYYAEFAEQLNNVARLEAPDFATLLTVMNNAGYDEATDDGHYDVEKVLLKLQGW